MIKAVLTGDVINSTGTDNFLEKLTLVLTDVSNHFKGSRFEIYRGDSFQCLLNKPEDSIRFAMLIRAGLRAPSYYSDYPSTFDAKIAIGIGPISNIRQTLGASTGDAFLLSGRMLDTLEGEKYRMGISLSDEAIDPLIETTIRFADDIISNWSSTSADTAYTYWLDGLNQSQLAEKMNISQPAVHKRFQLAKIDLLDLFDYNTRGILKQNA